MYEEPPLSIYFGGCAFGAGFYVGAHKAMVEKWGPDFYKKTLLSGGSAGTIFAVGIAMGKTPEYMDDMYRKVAQKALKHGALYHASVFLSEAVRTIVDSDPLAYKIIEGRCCFGTTSFYAHHRWHISWEDNEDLISSIGSSSHIPFYCKYNEGVKGVAAIDGAYGFAGRDLPHGNNTLYVGIDPNAEVTRTYTNPEMFFPPNGALYDDMVRTGYKAMMNWDGKMNDKVRLRLPNYSALNVLWILKRKVNPNPKSDLQDGKTEPNPSMKVGSSSISIYIKPDENGVTDKNKPFPVVQ
eukprot:gene11607-15545_t